MGLRWSLYLTSEFFRVCIDVPGSIDSIFLCQLGAPLSWTVADWEGRSVRGPGLPLVSLGYWLSSTGLTVKTYSPYCTTTNLLLLSKLLSIYQKHHKYCSRASTHSHAYCIMIQYVSVDMTAVWFTSDNVHGWCADTMQGRCATLKIIKSLLPFSVKERPTRLGLQCQTPVKYWKLG